MKSSRDTSLLPKLLVWFLAMMLSAYVTNVQAADWMRDSGKFYMSSHNNHVTFNVFLADLDHTNTYAQTGSIYAVNEKGRKLWLVDLSYVNEGNDENPFGKVKSRVCINEARAWFTNGYINMEQQISNGATQEYMIQKWGDSNHYLTAKVDFYYPAEMAGSKWTFHFDYVHNYDSDTNRHSDMTLGVATLSTDLGLGHFSANAYKYKRTGPDKIEFTVPALPDDVNSKLKEIHIHEGIYEVNLSYTKQDNTVLTQKETLECKVGENKTYTITIPENVGNPKKIDLSIKATDGLKDPRNYYRKETHGYDHSNAFDIIPIPSGLMTAYRQFDKAADLSWNAYQSNWEDMYLECSPYIYRIETNDKGEPLNGSWSKRGSIDTAEKNRSLGYTDNNVQQSTFYKYMIVNVPKAWIGNSINASSLSNPDEKLLAMLGVTTSNIQDTKPTMSIYNLVQDSTVTDKVKLKWQYSRVPTSSSTVKFKVLRKTSQDGEWMEYGSVNGDAEPKAKSYLSFTDTDLPGISDRYIYMIRLSLNDIDFESSPIYAGILSGSAVKTFTATKGTHEGTVRLSWEASQVGTNNTTFVISRRYVDSNSEYIRISTTSGKEQLYTYEDNTVQPGYYYEYKIDAYSDNVLQNSLTDAGFCQTRGVISGRITFGTGSSVEDVRLTLNSSDDVDGNTVRGYSKHVDGISTGLVWDANMTEMNKIFGSNKNYTLQMFVRPNENLSEGAVVGEIPTLGRLYLGSNQGDSYKLYLEKFDNISKNESQFSKYIVITAYLEDDTAIETGDKATYYSEEYGMWVYCTEAEKNAKYESLYHEGYRNIATGWYTKNQRSLWYRTWEKEIQLDKPVKIGSQTWQGKVFDSGLSIPSNIYSLVTVQYNSNGECTIFVNEASNKLTSSISTKDHSIIEDSTGILSSGGYYIKDDCLYKPEGVSNETILTLYSMATSESQSSPFFPNNATELSTNPNISFPLSIGGTTDTTVEEGFRGDITEVRVWDHILSKKESARYYDCVLNGRETGLALYWPMDEGLERYVFDASYTNDIPNGRHATVGNNISVSNIIPTDDQLSRYAVTNENGEYIIRGIPFVGSGSAYTIYPTRGIHKFSPTSRNGFISNGSLTLNNYDFVDVSSFPVSGKVTYLNTNIPADSIEFRIDGDPVQAKDKMVMTDANGEYVISVPIGNHLIEAYKKGHRLTSFPIDGTTYNFTSAETVNFIDSTLVNVTGRINGGFSDQSEPLGFKRSVNRLGKATIKLSLGKESQCSFNYILDEHGDGTFGTTNIPVASSTENINSTAYRAGGSHDDTYFIYITTDEKTGEFSAMLPPLKYKVESIKFDGGTDYDDLSVFAQNLPVLDATTTDKEKMKIDSLVTDNGTLYYPYSAKMIRQHRCTPLISFVQQGMKMNTFGDIKVPAITQTNTPDTVQVIKYTDTGYSYMFGHPIFRQGERYYYDIDVSEEYKNLDTKESFKEIPLDAVITILNDASVLTAVTAEKAMVNGKEVATGTEVKTPNIQLVPDSKGHATYEFKGGWPYFGEGHIRNMSVSVTVDGRTTMWHDPDTKKEALDMILLGSLPTGTNFMTKGTDNVDYILRRPPGSTSVASLEETTLDSYTTKNVTTDNESFGGGTYVSLTPTFEIESGVSFFKQIILAKSKLQVVSNETLTRVNGHKDSDYSTDKDAYTFTEKVTTPNSIPYSVKHGDFRPESGDTYIGHSTNMTFSKSNMLKIFKQSDGTYKIEEKEGISVSESFDTQFIFTQEYIEDYLIPNWKAFIKSKLQHVDGNHWDDAYSHVGTDEVLYFTSYNENDDQYGKANGDPSWGKLYTQRGGWPSYRMVDGTGKGAIDEVEQAINQINTWEATLRANEADKVKSFDNDNSKQNHSIGGGTTFNQTEKTEHTHSTGGSRQSYHTVNSETKFGLLLNNAGAYGIIKYQKEWGDQTDRDTTRTKTKTVSWTMSDASTSTALSVDVFKSPQGWGPIFRTRGGQTINPYEGETKTVYYTPTTNLNEATMRIEKPVLKIVGPAEQTSIPTGTDAKFTLQLYNGSETNTTCTYVLHVQENSNPDGAILSVDGTPLSNGKTGRPIKMAPGETIEKTLIVKQSNYSVTKYRDIKIVLKSEKDISTKSDPVALTVEFVPASAHVDLAVDHTVLNWDYKTNGGGLTAKMYNLDRQDIGLQGMRLRYRRKGIDSWTLVKQWATEDNLIAQGYSPMPDGSEFTEKVNFLEDGTYELQAQTFGKYGSKDVTYESNIIEVIQDTHGPKMLGMPSPLDGILTYENRNDMHIRFNEVLNGNSISKSDNFRIEGGFNNVVKSNTYPDVAAQLNGDKFETESTFMLANTNCAFDLWFYRQGDGNIISIGTDDDQLTISTHDGGKIRARLGSENNIINSDKQLPENKWVYIAFNYKSKNTEDSVSTITLLYADADSNSPIYVVDEQPVKNLTGNGKLAIGGNGMKGMMSELSFWNENKTASELYEKRNETKASYTPGLVGYWKMNEGHGTQLTDRARSRHIQMPAESWYINNKNLAAKFDGYSAMKVDISTFAPRKTDNFAIEMWFRGQPESLNVHPTLFSTLNGIRVGYMGPKLVLQVLEPELRDGIEVVNIKEEVVISDRNYIDNNWHHIALNVRRGTSAIVYIDGEAVKVIPEEIIPALDAQYLTIGGDEFLMVDPQTGQRNTYNNLQGDIDDVRIWSAALDGRLIKERMYDRLDSSNAGLVGYFPMEEINRSPQGNITTTFTTNNLGAKGSQLHAVCNLEKSENAPALLPGSSKMRMEDSQFTITTSNDEVYFGFNDTSLAQMDGNDFVVTVMNIKDEHANNSEAVEWMFHADFASVDWYNNSYEINISKDWDDTTTWMYGIVNKTSTPQTYEVSGIPSWMTIENSVGIIDKDVLYLHIAMDPTIPVGRYTEYLYLTDRLGITRTLKLNLTVDGDIPEWNVNPSLYESNMLLTGQVIIGDKISEYTNTKIAAFDNMGLCRGVASPTYVSSRDAYYVDMTIYGASSTEISTGERELTLKMYDASSGKTYPVVNITMPDGTTSTTLTYAPDAIIGSYDKPVEFRPTDLIQQSISLARGWTWMSIYVDPTSKLIGDILPKSKSELKKFLNVKSKTQFATAKSDGSAILGELKELHPGNMYKIQTSATSNFDIFGKSINVANTTQTIHPNYNWIGSLSNNVMSIQDAFADLRPEKGDRVKNRGGYAEYNGKGVWEGTLMNIVPGEGYIYLSKASEAKTFHYPILGVDTYTEAQANSVMFEGRENHFTVVDPYIYPDNMNITIVVEKDGQRIEDAEVGAFVGEECRGSVFYNNGYYFLTIMGSAESDVNNSVDLRVYTDGYEYIFEKVRPFVSDAFIGSLEEPYVLDLNATAIRSIYNSDEDDTDWYTLQGFKIGRKPTQSGVYIHQGKKVTIRMK